MPSPTVRPEPSILSAPSFSSSSSSFCSSWVHRKRKREEKQKKQLENQSPFHHNTIKAFFNSRYFDNKVQFKIFLVTLVIVSPLFAEGSSQTFSSISSTMHSSLCSASSLSTTASFKGKEEETATMILDASRDGNDDSFVFGGSGGWMLPSSSPAMVPFLIQSSTSLLEDGGNGMMVLDGSIDSQKGDITPSIASDDAPIAVERNTVGVIDDFVEQREIAISSSQLKRLASMSSRPSREFFHGPYKSIRETLDYNYHDVYSLERQAMQDEIIDRYMEDHFRNAMEGKRGKRKKNWIVFTAGAMGAGKTHTIRHLSSKNLFPLETFVRVDPDDIRQHLPEFHLYQKKCPELSGELTRKESGTLCEILTHVALERGCNVLVDGSLRDSDWYGRYFGVLRDLYGEGLGIAILYITAPREAVLRRAQSRSRITGRIVPNVTLEHALEAVPKSISILAPLSDFYCEIHNDDNEEIQLRQLMDGSSSLTNWESFRRKWIEDECDDNSDCDGGEKEDESFLSSFL